MNRALVTAALLVASTSVASAGTYLGLGVGPGANFNGDERIEDGGRSARLLGGYSFGRFSAEASITGQTLFLNDNGGVTFDTRELALNAKFNLPLGSGFEVFGKAGLHHTWISADASDVYSVDGNGLLVGAGFEYRVKTPVAAGSLWVDYTHYAGDLTGDVYAYRGAGVGMWMLGVSVGI